MTFAAAVFSLAISIGVAPAPKEGYLTLPHGKVWYAVYGADKPGIPMLVLHGGPGVPHNYLLNLQQLADDRPVIFYDQLGCGKSDKPDIPDIYLVGYYVDELARVRKALGLNKVVLYGHSWGTMLAASYLKTKPAGVAAAVMAGPSLKVKDWERDANRYIAALPKKDREAIAHAKPDSAAYKAANDAYDALHLCRLNPPPKDLLDALAGMGKAYLVMDGPSEFQVTGTLRHFDATSDLRRYRMPVLYICGEFDEAAPRTVAKFARMTPHASLAVIKGGSHLAMAEKPAAYMAAMRSFLKRVR